jgi:hypothetical protein
LSARFLSPSLYLAGAGGGRFAAMKRYLAWFVVIALAVAAGSLLAAWFADQFTAVKAAAWQSRPRIGFQPPPATAASPARATIAPATA